MAVLMLSLVACGGSSSEKESVEKESVEKKEKSTGDAGANKEQEVPNVEPPIKDHEVAVAQMPEKPLKLAFLGFQNNPFWNSVKDGAMAAKDYLSNYNTTVDYIVMGDVLDAKTVVAGIETAVAKEYDGIVVTPFSDGTETAINKAVEKGIPVITLYGESTKECDRLTFIGQDCYAAGQLAGEMIAEFMENKGKYGIITGNFTVTPHELRKKGAEDYLSQFEGIEEVGVFEAKDKAELTYNYAKDMITANPDIKAIYMTAGGPFGAAKAVKDMGKTGEIFVLGYDEVPENLKFVRTGEMTIIGQDPSGVSFDGLVRMYNYIVAGVEPVADFIPSTILEVTPENVDELFPE
jgi:ABC-type sugar transport system substrate-binding protein